MLIETNRLIIRPWQKDDVSHYIELSKDIGYNCFVPPGFFLVKGEDEAAEKINQRMEAFRENGVSKFPVFLKDTNRFIGTCGFSPYEINGVKEIELGYRLLLAHWGKGYATEAAQAVIAHAFEDLGKAKIFAFAIKQNPTSLAIIKKLGFTYQSPLLHAGLEHDLFVMTKETFARAA